MGKCSRSSIRSRNSEPRWSSTALSTGKLYLSSVTTLMISSIVARKSAWKYMIAEKSPPDRAGIKSHSNRFFRASQKCWMTAVAIWCCSSMVCRSYISSWSAAVSLSVKRIIRLRNTHMRAFLQDCSLSFRFLLQWTLKKPAILLTPVPMGNSTRITISIGQILTTNRSMIGKRSPPLCCPFLWRTSSSGSILLPIMLTVFWRWWEAISTTQPVLSPMWYLRQNGIAGSSVADTFGIPQVRAKRWRVLSQLSWLQTPMMPIKSSSLPTASS